MLKSVFLGREIPLCIFRFFLQLKKKNPVKICTFIPSKMGCKKLDISENYEPILTVVGKNPTAEKPHVESFLATKNLHVNYYPGGMMMPGRNFNSNESRYGWQGMEKVDEISGSGNHYTTEYREHDPRTEQWWSIDPEAASFPWQSPYVPMSRNPISRIDPLGNSDDWVEKTDDAGNKSIVWDENVTSANDPDLMQGDKYMGKEGFGLNEKTGAAVHYLPDGTQREYAQTIGEVTVTPSGDAYKSSNPSIGTTNQTGYTYNDRDLAVRNSVLSTDNPIATAIRSSEAKGQFWILNAEDYWAYYGHTTGNLLLMDKYIRMADAVTGGAPGQLKSTRGFNLSPTMTAKPKLAVPTSFSEYLKTQKGTDVGKYPGRGNWMKQKAIEYNKLKSAGGN